MKKRIFTRIYGIIEKQYLMNRLNSFYNLFSFWKLSSIIFFIIFFAGFVSAQPFIRTTGGLGQYGYFEKDAITNKKWYCLLEM